MVDFENPYDGDESPIKVTAWLASGVGAVNWGLMEFTDVNLVTDLLGADASGIGYGVIAVAGAVSLAGNFGVDVLGGDD